MKLLLDAKADPNLVNVAVGAPPLLNAVAAYAPKTASAVARQACLAIRCRTQTFKHQLPLPPLPSGHTLSHFDTYEM